MRIDYIKLKNYRQYREEEIQFPEDTAEVTIIKGDNGSGKSNILNAVTWCLYDVETHMTAENKEYPLPNTKTIAEASKGDKIEVRVEIELKDRNGRRHNIEHSKSYKKADDGDVEEVPGARDFSYAREVGNDMKLVNNPEHILNLNLPKDIKEYFFFDGEQLNQYFEQSSNERIKDAVFDISQLQVLDHTIYHVDKMKDEFLDKKENLSPEIQEKRNEIEARRDKMEGIEESLKEIRGEKQNIKKRVDELRESLRNSPDAGTLQEEKERLENEKDEFEEQLEGKKEEKLQSIVEKGSHVLAHDAITESLKLVEETEESGDIPIEYREGFINNLLDEGTCICGRDISEGDHPDARAEVKDYLEHVSELSDLEDNIMRGQSVLKRLTSFKEKFSEAQEEANEEIARLEDRIQDRNERIEEKKNQISDTDVEEIKRKQKKLDQLEEKLEGLQDRQTRTEVRKEEKEEQIGDIEKELEKELDKESKFEETKRLYDFCSSSSEVAQEIMTEIMQEVREEIEDKTEDWFFDLIWKEETYDSVVIDDDYNISVLDQQGRNSLNVLSAGETQTLALSFMAALNTVSGFYAPIIIDTPLGRIDPHVKRNIAENLPEYMGDRQVTLLVTGSEYTDELRDVLKDNVGKEYEIDFREGAEGSEAEVVAYGN